MMMRVHTFFPLLLSMTVMVACPTIDVPPDLCATYCEEVQRACGPLDPEAPGTGQYLNLEACKIYCKSASDMDPGAEGDEAVDTVSCRTYHASLAALEPATHCSHAGPTGGNVCGGYCEVYCGLMTRNCPDAFSGAQTCQDECESFATDGNTGDSTGDTVQCRINFAGLAGIERGSADGLAKCELAMPASSACGPVPTCDEFCATVLSSCTGGDSYYSDADDCQEVCATAQGWPAGSLTDTNLSTIGCRLAAANDAAGTTDGELLGQLCRNASETGGGTCGAYCDVYCDVFQRNCSDDFSATYDDVGACKTECEGFATTGKPGELSGDTVQCRIAYATAAGLEENRGQEELMCASAQALSNVCQ